MIWPLRKDRSSQTLAAMLALAVAGLMSMTACVASESDERVLGEILAQVRKLGTEARSGDTRQWEALISADYTEFDPYYSYLIDVGKGPVIDLQRIWDRFDRIPPTDRSTKVKRIQVYGNVAILTTTSYRKGALPPTGPLSQLKSVIVYQKQHGHWVLVHCHDGRQAGPDGIPTE